VLIRALILATWLVLFAIHAVHQLAPGLGLGDRQVSREVFAAQLGRTLHYRLVGAGETRMGQLTCAFREESGHFVQDVGLSVDADSPLVAQARLALATLGRDGGGNGRSAIAGQAEVSYDDRFRPTAVQVHAMAFGIPLSAEFALDHRGLTGWYVAAGQRRSVTMPEIDPASLAGLDLSLAMPPGLAPGDAWTTRTLGASGLSLSVRPVAHTVTTRETIATAAGPIAALRVTSTTGGTASVLWVDDRGTALRVEAAGLRLELDRVVAADGTRLWPAR
jgi:hypothetical protein